MWALVWMQIKMFAHFARFERISFKYTETWSLKCKTNKTSEKIHIHTHICTHTHIHTHKQPHKLFGNLRDPTQTYLNIPKYVLKIVRIQCIGKYHWDIWKYYLRHSLNFKFWQCGPWYGYRWKSLELCEIRENLIWI